MNDPEEYIYVVGNDNHEVIDQAISIPLDSILVSKCGKRLVMRSWSATIESNDLVRLDIEAYVEVKRG